MYKTIIIISLIILIILFNQDNECFTGFRKFGFLTEMKNDPTLFPFVIHNKKIPFFK